MVDHHARIVAPARRAEATRSGRGAPRRRRVSPSVRRGRPAHRPGHDASCAVGRPDAAENRPYPGNQFLRAEGLGEVVVRAEVERANLVRLLASGADDDDRRALLIVHLLEDLPAVNEREADIEQDDVDRPGPRSICEAVIPCAASDVS